MNKKLFLCLAISNLSGALICNFPVGAWNWDDLNEGFRNGVNSLATGKSEAQTPLPVPQAESPIGNSTSAQPCLPPPSVAAPSPIASSPVKHSAPVRHKKAVTEEPADRTIWLASRLKYPQSLTAIVDRFGTPSISVWDIPNSTTNYTTQTGRTIVFKVQSSYDSEIVTGYELQ